jgi:FAD/FMN-containing dehydrogenase
MNALGDAPETTEPTAAAWESHAFVLALRTAAARRPPLPVRVLTAREAAIAVRHAVDENLGVGLGTDAVDDSLVLDLSGMRRIAVDPDACTARVQPGVTIAELESAAAVHGLAVANLVAAQVVTWDGSVVSVSAAETSELPGFVVDATYNLA